MKLPPADQARPYKNRSTLCDVPCRTNSRRFTGEPRVTTVSVGALNFLASNTEKREPQRRAFIYLLRLKLGGRPAALRF